jgi:hypothetical protein
MTYPLSTRYQILKPIGVGFIGILTVSEERPWKPWIHSSMATCISGR